MGRFESDAIGSDTKKFGRRREFAFLSVVALALVFNVVWHFVDQRNELSAQNNNVPPPEDVVVKSLTLVDSKGKKRARLFINSHDATEFALLDAEEQPWIRLGASGSRAEMLIQEGGKEDKSGMAITVDKEDGGPILELYSAADANLIALDASKKRATLIVQRVKTIGEKNEGTMIALTAADTGSIGRVVPFLDQDKKFGPNPEGALFWGSENNGPMQIRRVEKDAGPVWPTK